MKEKRKLYKNVYVEIEYEDGDKEKYFGHLHFTEEQWKKLRAGETIEDCDCYITLLDY